MQYNNIKYICYDRTTLKIKFIAFIAYEYKFLVYKSKTTAYNFLQAVASLTMYWYFL